MAQIAYTEIIQRASRLFSFWGNSRIKGKAGIALTADGIVYARLNLESPRPLLTSCGYEPVAPEKGNAELEALTQLHSLRGCQLGVCLAEGSFQLSLLEAPAVKRSELHQALQWRVKDLIDFPLEELVLDYVDVPPTKSGSGLVYAVTAQAPAIQTIVDQTSSGVCTLERIDIPALALQNLAGRLPEAEAGIALLNLTRQDSLLTLGRGQKLYLSRGVDVHSTDLTGEGDALQDAPNLALYEQLLLDIQRSLDYYDSFFVDPPIRHLLISSQDRAYDGLIDYLSENLTIDVRGLYLDEILNPGEDLAIEVSYLGELMLAVGTALWQAELDT